MSAAVAPDLLGIAVIMITCLAGGALPFIAAFIMAPEARKMVMAKFKPVITVIKFHPTGYCSLETAKPSGVEGQYIEEGTSGLNTVYYVLHRSTNQIFNERYMWNGIRRPLFVAWAKKTELASPTVPMAMHVISNKPDLPLAIKEWAASVNISIEEEKTVETTVNLDPSDPSQGTTTASQVVSKIERYDLVSINMSQFEEVFKRSLSPEAYLLLAKKHQLQGVMEGSGFRSDGMKTKGSNKLLWIILGGVVIAAIALVAIMALSGGL